MVIIIIIIIIIICTRQSRCPLPKLLLHYPDLGKRHFTVCISRRYSEWFLLISLFHNVVICSDSSYFCFLMLYHEWLHNSLTVFGYVDKIMKLFPILCIS
jgi:hypothetical protein